ncbi:hypothetical protein ABC974_16560 [Sphingomonas oligophenolica]|uniref:Uncharacterized protein n=1 Tax=Sphingomonas oligophenolica TaxID=301154 RepID=A0ABU9Y628_9SPHN
MVVATSPLTGSPQPRGAARATVPYYQNSQRLRLHEGNAGLNAR